MAAKPQKKAAESASKTTRAVADGQSTILNAMMNNMKAFPQMPGYKLDANLFKGKQFEKVTQGAAVLGQDQVDAVMKSSSIFTRGLEDLIKTCMDIAQDAGEKSASATKTLMACKTLNELTEYQTRLAQSSFDDFMNNATKISEMSVKLCTEALQPINDQLGKTIKKASSTLAA